MKDQYIQQWADCHNDRAIRNVNGWLHSLFAMEYQCLMDSWEKERNESNILIFKR
ncbi:MAG: hypothetical protein ACUZ8H_02190 [Candidatus Anammoxibacter sp.]